MKTSRRVVFLLLLWIALIFGQEFVVVNDWLNFKNFIDAENYCVTTYGTHLVSIHNAALNNAIQAQLPATPLFWIGLREVGSNNNWQWTDNSPLDYINWESNPDNNINCVMMRPLTGQWKPTNCVNVQPFVCSLPGNGHDDPHFKTLDGYKFKYDGACSYLLTTNKCDQKESLSRKNNDRPKFEVISHHHGKFRRVKSDDVKIQKLSINLWKGKALKPMLIELEKNIVEINGYQIHVPYHDSLFSIIQQYRSPLDKPIHVHFHFGLDIFFSDGGAGAFEISVSKDIKTCGLLGNNNQNMNDDLQIRYNSTRKYTTSELDEKTIIDIGDSWMVPNSKQPLRCKLYPKHSYLSTFQCTFEKKSVKNACENMIQHFFKKLKGSQVEKCFLNATRYGTIDPTRIYDDCVTEICSCEKGKKNNDQKCVPQVAIDEFKQICHDNGVTDFPKFNWKFQ